MFRLLRFLVTVGILGSLVYCGATVNLGKRTFFGHVSNIWNSQEAQELREDVGETTAPVIEKAERGVQAGWEEYRRDQPQPLIPASTPPVDGAPATANLDSGEVAAPAADSSGTRTNGS